MDPSYFRTLQIPLLAGGVFNPANSGENMPPVAVISESAARLLWPDESPVGQYLPRTEARTPEESFRVIGVVADVQVRSLREPPRAAMYVPATQEYDGTMTVFARAATGRLRPRSDDVDAYRGHGADRGASGHRRARGARQSRGSRHGTAARLAEDLTLSLGKS